MTSFKTEVTSHRKFIVSHLCHATLENQKCDFEIYRYPPFVSKRWQTVRKALYFSTASKDLFFERVKVSFLLLVLDWLTFCL